LSYQFDLIRVDFQMEVYKINSMWVELILREKSTFFTFFYQIEIILGSKVISYAHFKQINFLKINLK